jgi:tRNA threonylcarbamoyladenosine biosynthesis protein TsaE
MTIPTGERRDLASLDPETTRQIGAMLAQAARPGDVVCLWGDLGAGKTQLAKGFGAGLAVDATISSPSFILMAEYAGRLPLFHIDLYRLADGVDAHAAGLLDDRQRDGVTLIEWPERFGDALPSPRLDVILQGTGEEPRRIGLVPSDASYARYLEAAP